MSLDPANGLISGTPAVGAGGVHSVEIQAIDDVGCSGQRRYDLLIREDADYLVGEGPGPDNTNRVRVYSGDGTTTPVDFQAYGAGRWGTKVASGDVDGKDSWEILDRPRARIRPTVLRSGVSGATARRWLG